MEDNKEYLKIRESVDLEKLLELGFEKHDYSNEVGYAYKGIQYEYRDRYPLEDDGTRYEDEYGCDYRSIISIGSDRKVFVEVMNNDCSYHVEGSEINPVLNMIHKLTKLDYFE